MVLLCASSRCLGSWTHFVTQYPQRSYKWRGIGCGSSLVHSRQRRLNVSAAGRIDEVAICEGFDSRQIKQVSRFVDSLLDWNQRMNLTAVTERDAVMERHIMDSLALLPVMEMAYGQHNSNISTEHLKLVDVGTGAGLPGIVLAIARPAWQITLLESLQKRCNFLDYAVEKSGLSNVKVLRARAEDGGQDKNHREAYDVAVARAVADMRVLSELCLPFVRVGGVFVAAKGPNPQEEVESAKKAITLLGGTLLSISDVNSTGPLGQRTAIVCHKRKSTPAKYPRRPGTPKMTPL